MTRAYAYGVPDSVRPGNLSGMNRATSADLIGVRTYSTSDTVPAPFAGIAVDTNPGGVDFNYEYVAVRALGQLEVGQEVLVRLHQFEEVTFDLDGSVRLQYADALSKEGSPASLTNSRIAIEIAGNPNPGPALLSGGIDPAEFLVRVLRPEAGVIAAVRLTHTPLVTRAPFVVLVKITRLPDE